MTSVIEGGEKTAGPFTTIRSGRDDKGEGIASICIGRIGWTKKKLSIPIANFILTSLPLTLSSRPERTRISCHAALDEAACAPFCKGKAHDVHQRHQVQQEIRGSAVEGSAVRPSDFPNSRALTQTLKPLRSGGTCCFSPYNHPLLRASRAASIRLAAPSLLIASDK
jgi:hypothetical protein